MTKDIPDYLRVAKDNLSAPKGITHEQMAGRLAAAQAAATIALAEEQRTANLIAYLNTGYNSWAYHPGEAVLRHVQGRIEERLGLA